MWPRVVVIPLGRVKATEEGSACGTAETTVQVP
jgi:hypothetical protein